MKKPEGNVDIYYYMQDKANLFFTTRKNCTSFFFNVNLKKACTIFSCSGKKVIVTNSADLGYLPYGW